MFVSGFEFNRQIIGSMGGLVVELFFRGETCKLLQFITALILLLFEKHGDWCNAQRELKSWFFLL